MKKIVYLFVILAVSFDYNLNARDIQETILRAHKLYEEGNISQALELYSSIEKKGPATWYNMGNCYYLLGNYLDSLICWSKAERDASWHELAAIHHNIDQVYKALGVQKTTTLRRFLNRSVKCYLSFLSLYGWQILFLFVWVLLLFLVAHLINNCRYITLSLLSLLVVLLATAVYMKYELSTVHYGIVTEKNLTLYAGPNKGFHELGSLAQASKIIICAQQENWVKVCDCGRVGWVPLESIAIV